MGNMSMVVAFFVIEKEIIVMDNLSVWAKGVCTHAYRYYRISCVRYGSAKRYIYEVQEIIQSFIPTDLACITYVLYTQIEIDNRTLISST
jgi:hypothetical protein